MGDMQCVSVSIFEDIRVENDEDFFVDFGNRNGITVNPSASSARITILNDDGEYMSYYEHESSAYGNSTAACLYYSEFNFYATNCAVYVKFWIVSEHIKYKISCRQFECFLKVDKKTPCRGLTAICSN